MRIIQVEWLDNNQVRVYDENMNIIDTFDNPTEYRDWLVTDCRDCMRKKIIKPVITKEDIVNTGKRLGVVTHVDEEGVIHFDEKALMAFHKVYSAIHGVPERAPSVLLNYQDFKGIVLETGEKLEVQFEFEVLKQDD